MLGQAKPIGGFDPSIIMDAGSEEARADIMRQMGVMNADPPLPHSPCLKNIRTGVVLPWNELLAQQKDLVVCCDEDGNTDPAAWEPKVITETVSNEALALMAQQTMFVSEADNPYEHYMPKAKQVTGATEYERHGVIPYAEVRQLWEKLDNADKADSAGSVDGPERPSSGQ